ncbi:hypothetical protein F511_23930 [Dorcoceras hygrometricum]|uniref:Uncharacterized protein n=1 Tax=Dorcoceras hygrometricum TaxID=472368 RepID=A0A2Z7BL08_9LAMI|nr:hypothetical protein F511_23930 [Dorcoceras hygrometricum]
MAASFFVNTMLVDFESAFDIEHTGMVCMFKPLEDTGLKGFLEASSSVYEGAVLEFFADAKVDDEQHAQDEPYLDAEQEVEQRAQVGSFHSSSSRGSKPFGYFSVHNEDSENSVCPSPISDANNMYPQGPSPDDLQIVVYTANREENNSSAHEESSTQAGPQQVIISEPQEAVDADIKFKEMKTLLLH